MPLHQMKSDWFSEECKNKRNDFLRLLNKYRQNYSTEFRQLMVKARHCFKTCVRKCKFDYNVKQTNKLISARQGRTYFI